MADEVRFHYIKSNHFRVVRGDGIFGGLTPKGDISVAFYSERMAIPQQTVQLINPDGTLGDEDLSKRVVKEGIVRELEVDIVMNIEMVRALRAWLETQIKVYEEAVAKPAAAREDRP